MAYTNKKNVESYLQRDLSTDETFILNTLIKAVTEFIDAYTHRHFEAGDADEVRYFDGERSTELFIDDCLAITKVEEYDVSDQTVDSEVPSTDYVLLPHNKTPKTSIVSTNGSCFLPGLKKYKITGTWGFAEETPEDIQAICTYLIAQIFLNPESLQNESIEGYSRAFNLDMLPPLYKTLLEARVKISIL